MKSITVTFLCLILVGFCSISAFGQAKSKNKLASLKKYAGEIPVDNTVKPRRNLFNLPELKSPLVALLSAKNFRRLVSDFNAQSPIEVVTGEYKSLTATTFLIMSGFNKNTGESAIVVIDIGNTSANPPIFVGFQNSGGGRPEWFASKGDYTDLPSEVRNKLQN